jgi:hypothetical protein
MRKSTPMVARCSCVKVFSDSRRSSDVFPTPLSPVKTTFTSMLWLIERMFK